MTLAPLAAEETLRLVYDEHAGELYGFALRTLGDRGSAEDLVQEVFLRAWLHADAYRPERSSVRSWLFAIARNLAIDTARARAARPQPGGELPESLAAPGDELEQLEQRVLLLEALARLSAEHRAVLVAVAVRGHSLAEAAAALSVPVGTVKSRLYYGLKSLRVVADELGIAP